MEQARHRLAPEDRGQLRPDQIACGGPREGMKPRHLIPALLLFLLIAYPLSGGPVAGRYNHYRHSGPPPPDPPQWLLVLYTPLENLCRASPQIGRAFVWYRDLWKPKG